MNLFFWLLGHLSKLLVKGNQLKILVTISISFIFTIPAILYDQDYKIIIKPVSKFEVLIIDRHFWE
ncbi:hypothetical protein ATE47_02185 [Chryseobacterium sp. IHB B 17019]|nr:hypothetical protein ATE47_02185 [Chryseobacterium sp. IHB B 17019]